MQFVSKVMRNLEERLFLFLKNSRFSNVKNSFLKGVTQNHCLGFPAMYYQEI